MNKNEVIPMLTINKIDALTFHLVNNFLPSFDKESIDNVIDCMTKYWNGEVSLDDMVSYIDDERIYGEFLNDCDICDDDCAMGDVWISDDDDDCEENFDGEDITDDEFLSEGYEYTVSLSGRCYDYSHGEVECTIYSDYGFDAIGEVKAQINEFLLEQGLNFIPDSTELSVVRYDIALSGDNPLATVNVSHTFPLCEDFIPNKHGVKVRTLFIA
jgi:hypothetical protein